MRVFFCDTNNGTNEKFYENRFTTQIKKHCPKLKQRIVVAVASNYSIAPTRRRTVILTFKLSMFFTHIKI